MKSRQDTIILVDYNNLEDLKSNMDGRYHYFYKILNTVNNKYYYGIHTTDDIYDGYAGSGTLLKSVYKKYGKENCIKYILKFFEDRRSLLEYEKEIINNELLEDYNCYNILVGGGGTYNPMTPVITIDGESKVVSKEEYKNNKHIYKHPTSGKIHINNGIKNKLVLPSDLEKWLQNGWMIGETNKSTIGKIVINKEGENDRFIYENELQQYLDNGWKRGGKTRNSGQKSFAKDLIWINKDGKQKRIKTEEVSQWMENGWVKGTCQSTLKGYIRITNGYETKNIKPDNIEDLNYYLNNGWWKGAHSKAGIGYVWIKKDNKMLSVRSTDLDKYIAEGWKRGRIMTNYVHPTEGKISVNKNGKTMMIDKDSLDKYLSNGWKRGNPKCGGSHNLKKIRVNKNGEIKNIDQSELEKYLNEGWEKGMGRSIMKGRLRINNGVVEKFVSEKDYENIYKEQGFIKGLLKPRK